MSVRITNIQRFSLHDGPGIRTTVFLKGCNLRCPWCCNPENIDFNIEHYVENELEKDFGYDIDLEDLEKVILKDEAFYDNGKGGVTFSGGEPLLQIEKMIPLLESLKSKNINICFETALSVDEKLVLMALNYADFIYIDIKSLADTSLTGLDLETYLNNIELVDNSGIKKENVVFRIPLNYECTLNEDNLIKISSLLKSYPDSNVEIFKTHNLAETKYGRLNKQYKSFKQLSDEDMESVSNRIRQVNKNARIISL